MQIAACLLVYTLAVLTIAPWVLTRLTRSARAPRAGVAVWLAAMGSVVAAVVAAPFFLAASVLHPTAGVDTLSLACIAALQALTFGGYGTGIQIAVLTVAIVVVLRLVWHLVRFFRVGRARRHRHAEAARIVGRRVSGVDAVVLDSPERAAYCLPGRPRTIVITTGALDALSDTELAAVLAHERAHLREHHHLVLACAHGLCRAFPRIPMFTAAALDIARLLECCADDAAARRHGGGAVSGALLALAGPHAPPQGALALAGPTAAERAERLLAPPARIQQGSLRIVLIAAAVALLSGPVATVALSASGGSLCFLPNG